MDNLIPAIAIDGPVAAGKGTIAGLLSKRINGFHLYTGSMYRCLALYCLRHSTPLTEDNLVIDALNKIKFDLNGDRVYLNNEDVSEAIKDRSVTSAVSIVAAISKVREEMVKRQQEIGLRKIEEGKVVIAEGRDAATKIFPNAKLKVFLTASPEVRAKRRYEQLGGEKNSAITLSEILHDTIERDRRDSNRTADPLVKEPEKYGYFVLDDSNLTEEQTIEAIVDKWEEVTK